MPKAATALNAMKLTDIPNIGQAIAADLCAAGIQTPQQLRDTDPQAVYEALRGPMGQRHDPCALDVMLAAHDFMNGGPVQPWWHFTAQRRALLAKPKKA